MSPGGEVILRRPHLQGYVYLSTCYSTSEEVISGTSLDVGLCHKYILYKPPLMMTRFGTLSRYSYIDGVRYLAVLRQHELEIFSKSSDICKLVVRRALA